MKHFDDDGCYNGGSDARIREHHQVMAATIAGAHPPTTIDPEVLTAALADCVLLIVASYNIKLAERDEQS